MQRRGSDYNDYGYLMRMRTDGATKENISFLIVQFVFN